MPDKRRIRAKVCLVGESGVGKTSLVRRMARDQFDDRYIPTPSTCVSTVEFEFPEENGCQVTLQMDIWDITGQKAFRKFLSDAYFHKCRYIIGVCDATRGETLQELEDWIKAGRSIAGSVPVQMVVNKMDVGSTSIRHDPMMRKLTEDYNSPFVFLSARTGQNIDFVFEKVAREIVDGVLKDISKEEESMRFKWSILDAIARRGRLGASKDYFFSLVKGVGFDVLSSSLEALAEKGHIQLSWSGTTDFVAFPTEEGIREAARGPRRNEDAVVDTVVG